MTSTNRRSALLLALTSVVLLPAALRGQAPGTWRLSGEFGDGLGSSFAAGPDLDGDGVGELLVGMPTQDVGGLIEAGRVQVLSGANPQLVLLDVPGETEQGRFGQSVAWMGDLDDDGVPDLAVGAPGAFAGSPGSNVYVAILSGADGSELMRLLPDEENIHDGGFERPGSDFGHPWTAIGSASRSTTATAGMPVSGSSYLELSSVGSGPATPPSSPGGFGDLPAGANSVRHEFRLTSTAGVLQGTLVFVSEEVGAPQSENDFMSVDVSAGGVHRNVLLLDTMAEFPMVVNGDPATAPVAFAVDLAQAFPAADTDTLFTLTISVGNAVDTLVPSLVLVDDVRLVGGGVTPTPGASVQAGLWFGASLANVGDVNGDDIPDLAVGSPGTYATALDAAAGSACLYSGADGSLLVRFDGGADDSQFGSSVAAAGDVDGDGIPDWLVGSRGDDAVGGVLLSGADGAPLETFSAGTRSHVSGGVDLNGDALPDWVSGESENDQLRVFDNAGGPLYAAPLSSVIQSEDVGDLGAHVEFVGDIDGDGVTDFAAGSPSAVGGGFVSVYSGRTSRELFTLFGDAGNAALGTTVSAAGDVDLDGYDDLLVGDPAAAAGAGEFQVVHGGNPWHAAPGLRLDMEHDGGSPQVVRITAGAGERLTLRAKAAKKSLMRPRLRVVGPLPEETVVLAAEDSMKSDTLAVAKLTLESGGDYRIEILDDGGAGGHYRFQSRAKPAVVKQPLVDEADQNFDIPLGRLRIRGTLGAGETHRTGFTAPKGTRLSVKFVGGKTDILVPGLRLISAGAKDVTVFESPVAIGKSVGLNGFELPANGAYILEVFSQVVTGGAYELRTSAKLPKETRKPKPVADLGSLDDN